LEEDVHQFFTQLGANDEQMSLSTLTDFMSKSFNDRHFSFEDHQNY
jgi:hypothetical protein